MQKKKGSMVPLFRDINFHKAIVIPGENIGSEKVVLRLAALCTADQGILLVIRCSTTNFQVNHIEARCILQHQADIREDSLKVEEVLTGEIQPFDPAQSLYKNVLFQDGRFRRIENYRIIEARRCCGQLSAGEKTQWFSQHLPQNCLMGDPGVRDAALHAIQVCIPHKIVIPLAVEKIEMGIFHTHQAYRMLAIELEDRGNQLLYDLKIVDKKGAIVEYWHKITLHVIGEPPHLHFNSPLLLAPFFERSIAAIRPEAGVKTLISPITTQEERMAGSPNHRPDGRPDSLAGTEFQSASYTEDWKLTVAGSVPVGCDLQYILDKQEEGWAGMLGRDGWKLAEIVADIAQEQSDIAATRVWTVREAMKKAGLAVDAPLTVSPDSSAQWLVFNSGGSTIFSSSVSSTRKEPVLCMAVALAGLK